jgi:hypothetical protein
MTTPHGQFYGFCTHLITKPGVYELIIGQGRPARDNFGGWTR